MFSRFVKNIFILTFLTLFSVQAKVFDGPCPKIQSSDEKFECESVFDEEDLYIPLAHLPVGDRTINIYHNPFQSSLQCLRMQFDCPIDKNLVFLTPRCYTGEISEDVIDYHDCMPILSPMTDRYRGAKGSYQPSHECADKIANYTTHFLTTDSGALVLWGCLELSGIQKGKHSEGAWIFIKASNEKKQSGVELDEAFKMLKNVTAKPEDFVTTKGKKNCECASCMYGADCAINTDIGKSELDD